MKLPRLLNQTFSSWCHQGYAVWLDEVIENKSDTQSWFDNQGIEHVVREWLKEVYYDRT